MIRLKFCGGVLAATLSLVGCGCSSKSQAAPDVQANTTRVIITFASAPPAIDDVRMNALLAEACQCVPTFIRPYLNNALIYRIKLTRDLPFSSFESALIAKGRTLGIRAVEQDQQQYQ